jgi:hypothetical protein
MANDNGNPFADETLTNHPSVEAQPADGNPFGDPALTSPEQAQADSGQFTNDVGNTVIVPKEGESFSDTMQRAVAQGKATTQDQINAELQTAPKKAAQTLAAAAGIGVGGTAALAAPGEIGAALEHLHAAYGAPALDAIEAAAKAHPVVAKLLTKGLEAAGLMSLGKYMKLFGSNK